ncbi:MAG: alpha/beta fold hydrolase [Betaproteobacteria bacterium]|nr:MAG: alpha/beta fold hydrolase [Betaproteobacteria bacterium]
MPGAEPCEIRAGDGYRLGATLFRPATGNGRALQINAAAGVKQEYYGKFAAYLAGRGFSVLTFDYRGIGRSGSFRLKNARMRDWAELDAAAALDFLAQTNKRLMAIGHSFGGQSFALIPGAERLAAALAVGSQSGYWRHWRGAPRAGMWLLTHALLPGISRLFGYFPAAAFGQGENLPAGVAIEWASWCRNPDYLVGALGAKEQYARFSAPLRLYWMADDLYAPLGAAQALLRLYPRAPSELKRVAPRELGAERIFGLFREQFRDTLWRDAADWLERH